MHTRLELEAVPALTMPPCKLQASPKSSASSLCCTNTFAHLPQCTPSMAGLLMRAENGVSSVNTQMAHSVTHLCWCHQLFWLRPLRRLGDCVVIVNAPLSITRLLPEHRRRRVSVDTIHHGSRDES